MSPGDEVICVEAAGGMGSYCVRTFGHKVNFPEVGAKYVVRDVFNYRTRRGEDIPMVLLHELKNPDVKYWDRNDSRRGLIREAGFRASAFRKLDKTDTKSSMDVFLKDADPASEQWDNRKIKTPAFRVKFPALFNYPLKGTS